MTSGTWITTPPEAEAWDRKALELHREVVDALGPSFEVTYDE